MNEGFVFTHLNSWQVGGLIHSQELDDQFNCVDLVDGVGNALRLPLAATAGDFGFSHVSCSDRLDSLHFGSLRLFIFLCRIPPGSASVKPSRSVP